MLKQHLCQMTMSYCIISKKGGYGNSRLTQDNLHFSTEYVMEPFNLGSTEHSISIGSIYQATKYQFYRPQDVHQKSNPNYRKP